MYERGYKTSGSPLRFMLRRSSLVECASVLHGTCLESVEFFFIRHYVQPCLSNNPKYTFAVIKSSLPLAYYRQVLMPYHDLHTFYVWTVKIVKIKK